MCIRKADLISLTMKQMFRQTLSVTAIVLVSSNGYPFQRRSNAHQVRTSYSFR